MDGASRDLLTPTQNPRTSPSPNDNNNTCYVAETIANHLFSQLFLKTKFRPTYFPSYLKNKIIPDLFTKLFLKTKFRSTYFPSYFFKDVLRRPIFPKCQVSFLAIFFVRPIFAGLVFLRRPIFLFSQNVKLVFLLFFM